MGDNRDNSADSRYWGFVPRSYVVGKPLLVYWSYDAPTADLDGVDRGSRVRRGSAFPDQDTLEARPSPSPVRSALGKPEARYEPCPSSRHSDGWSPEARTY